jgi:hypothetical protein
MKTPPKELPDNIEVFRIGKWRVDHFDQKLMKTMRKIADERGSTIEQVMDGALVEFVERCEVNAELATKVISFPMKRRPKPNTSGTYRSVNRACAAHAFQRCGQTMPKASTLQRDIFSLLEESKRLHESLRLSAQKLTALIRSSQKRRRELRREVWRKGREPHLKALFKAARNHWFHFPRRSAMK